MQEYDYIIIGAGHNGLILANYLAKAGFKVVVFEKNAEAGGGVSSEDGITIPGYAASKGGIGQLTKALSNEWSKYGVNVNAIAPGYIETDNTKALREDPVRNQGIMKRIPLGRWGTTEDLKGAVVFLASSASDYVCGTILIVDGGWTGR